MRLALFPLLLLLLMSPRAFAGTFTDVAGTVHQFTLSSGALGEDREILVALPDDYDASGTRYPVLYVLDAEWHFLPAVAAVRMLAETSYIASHRLPRLIVVGVVNVDRSRDYTPTRRVNQPGFYFPTSGGGDAFLTFLEEELVPFVHDRFRAQPCDILAGWSFGGLLTMHALLDRPDIFDAYLAISPSLWWDDEVVAKRAVELVASGAVRERDLVLTIGTAEDGGLCYNAVHELVRRWDEKPLPGLRMTFLEIPGEDHNHSPYTAYFDGLRALFADWFFPEEAFAGGLDSLDAHYAELSRRRGYTIDVPDHIYEALARSFLAEERPADAIAVMRARCEREPASAMSFFALGEVCRKAHDNGAARRAYRKAVELELKTSAPDSVFINYVEKMIEELNGKG